jgi:DNA-directed RNA polymerase subunit RPC12/RpoP
MLCPLCNEEMEKNQKLTPRNKHNSMKCPRCSFVIFYKGIVGLTADLV